MIDPNGEIMRRLTAAMLPGKVCRTCGEPSRRIVEKSERYAKARSTVSQTMASDWSDNVGNRSQGLPSAAGRADIDGWEFSAAEYVTLGWSDCGHDDWRPGTVLWIWWGDR